MRILLAIVAIGCLLALTPLELDARGCRNCGGGPRILPRVLPRLRTVIRHPLHPVQALKARRETSCCSEGNEAPTQRPIERRPAVGCPGCPDCSGPTCPCPTCPGPIGAVQENVPNFGVELDKLGGPEAYKHCNEHGFCKYLTRKQVSDILIGADKLSDDTTKLRITAIGDGGEAALAELARRVPDLDRWAICRALPRGHWALDVGFVQTGSPTIYCQAPDGKVLHRQDDFQGGADALAEALRKARDYDPKKDPDRRKPDDKKPDVRPDDKKPNQPEPNNALSVATALAIGAGVVVLKQIKG